MPDHNDDKIQEDAMSVYEYIEKYYKEEWSKKDNKSGLLVDWGIIADNRWEQFETIYRSNYAECSAVYMSDNEFQARLIKKSQEMDEYYEIHGTPKEDRVDVFTSQEIHEEIWREMEEYAQSQASDSAALEAFNAMGQGPLFMEDDDRISAMKNAMNASANAKKEDIIEELEAALIEKADQQPEYLVRGAPLRCNFGSHMRYLDMLETHGVYLDDKPIMHKIDCIVGENIMPFGICSSPTCALEERGSFFAGAETDQDGNYLQSPDDRVISGIVCKPEIIGECWENYKSETKIAQNATSAVTSPEGCDCYEAITTASYLLCKSGGLIFPMNSGQLKYSSYTAPFMNYPHAGNGSEEEERQAFEKWCEKYDICPYYPGTDDYIDWYQKRIDGLKESGATEKKIRAAYEECLDNAYLYGLDRMGEENRKQVKDMVDQYTGSGLLNEKDVLETQKKYAGLRLDFGYNSQKNLANATPEEDAFYQYYREKAGEIAREQEELNAELQQIGYAQGSGYNQEVRDVAGISTKIRELNEKKEELYGRFSREVGLYDGYLDEERKKQAQEVTELFQQ